MPDITYLTSGEAAAQLHVSPQTLRTWTEAGRIPAETTSGGHRRYDSAEVAYLGHLERGGAHTYWSAAIQLLLREPGRPEYIANDGEYVAITADDYRVEEETLLSKYGRKRQLTHAARQILLTGDDVITSPVASTEIYTAKTGAQELLAHFAVEGLERDHVVSTFKRSLPAATAAFARMQPTSGIIGWSFPDGKPVTNRLF